MDSSDPIKSVPATSMVSGPRHIGQEAERPADGEFVDDLEARDVHLLQIEVAVLRARLYAAESLAQERSERIEDLRGVIGMIPPDRLKGDHAVLGLADGTVHAATSGADQPPERDPDRRRAGGDTAGETLAAIWEMGPALLEADGPPVQETEDSSAALPAPEATEFVAAESLSASPGRRRWWRRKR